MSHSGEGKPVKTSAVILVVLSSAARTALRGSSSLLWMFLDVLQWRKCPAHILSEKKKTDLKKGPTRGIHEVDKKKDVGYWSLEKKFIREI